MTTQASSVRTSRDAETKRPIVPIPVANAVAYASLACSLSVWVAAPFAFLPFVSRMTGFQFFKIIAAGVVLAFVSLVLRSKIWRIALPVSLVIFFHHVCDGLLTVNFSDRE